MVESSGVAILKSLPRHVIDILKHVEGEPGIAEQSLDAVDSKLVNTLLPFQKEGIWFAISRCGRVLIADDMGLGKTIQAIAVAAYYREQWPVLIVCPSSMRYTWSKALIKWLPSLDEDLVTIPMSAKELIGEKCQVCILSYDLMVRRQTELTSKGFGVVIYDESHFLKNAKSQRTKAAMTISKYSSRVILLSGTPALSRPSELYTQIKIVNPKIFTSFHVFGMRYCDAKENPWGWDYSGASNTKELQIVLEETIMIRRMKKDVISQLPSKRRQVVILDPKTVKTQTAAMVSASREMMKTSLKGAEKRGQLLSYFCETGSAKLQAVKDYISDLLESDQKFIVFAHHTKVLEALAILVEKKVKSIRIDGSTNAETRQYLCDKFQVNDDYKVALLSITAANMGITLTAAALVIFAELYWNPGHVLQAEDRAYRIGQQDSVDVRYLVAQNTADDYLWLMIQQKLQFLTKAGLSGETFSDVETRVMKDPRQKEILEYLSHELCTETDEDDDLLVEALEVVENCL